MRGSAVGDSSLTTQAAARFAGQPPATYLTGGVAVVMVSLLAGEVRIVVADDGDGIPAEHLPQVFDRFYRSTPPTAAGKVEARLREAEAMPGYSNTKDEHLSHCVVDAARAGGAEQEIKLREASEAIARLVRS